MRSRSARSCVAIRCCPSAERSPSWDRSAALAPVSMPSDVALSGERRSRLSATPSSSASASASVAAVGALRVHPFISGSAAADTSAAIASRRPSKGPRTAVSRRTGNTIGFERSIKERSDQASGVPVRSPIPPHRPGGLCRCHRSILCRRLHVDTGRGVRGTDDSWPPCRCAVRSNAICPVIRRRKGSECWPGRGRYCSSRYGTFRASRCRTTRID